MHVRSSRKPRHHRTSLGVTGQTPPSPDKPRHYRTLWTTVSDNHSKIRTHHSSWPESSSVRLEKHGPTHYEIRPIFSYMISFTEAHNSRFMQIMFVLNCGRNMAITYIIFDWVFHRFPLAKNRSHDIDYGVMFAAFHVNIMNPLICSTPIFCILYHWSCLFISVYCKHDWSKE